jgi:hypothetical protein
MAVVAAVVSVAEKAVFGVEVEVFIQFFFALP